MTDSTHTVLPFDLDDPATLAGAFADGWTDTEIDAALAAVGDHADVRLAAVWDYADDIGCGGDSDLRLVVDGVAHPAPGELWGFLVDGDDTLDAAATALRAAARRAGGGDGPDTTGSLPGLRRVSAHNYVTEIRAS